MKVAYVIGGLPFGGVENWLLDLTRKVAELNIFEYKVFNVSGAGVKMPEFIQGGVDVVCIGSGYSSLATHRVDTALKLRAQLLEYSPDIIHTLHFGGDYFGRIASLGLNIPVVTHLRNIKHEKKIWRRVANKILSAATNMYLSVSQAVAEVVAQDHNLFKKPSRVLYNAVNPEKFDVPAHDLAAMYGLSGKIILGVGRYVAQKRFDLLLQALKIVLDSGRDMSVVLVGEGGEREALEQLVRDLALEKKVVLTGYRQDVPQFMRGADLLVAPSDFEGFSIVLLEAMFCGLPAIVSRFVPALEIAGESALVCKRTPESVAECIIKIMDNAGLHIAMSQSGIHNSALYTIESYAYSLVAIYDELLSKKER